MRVIHRNFVTDCVVKGKRQQPQYFVSFSSFVFGLKTLMICGGDTTITIVISLFVVNCPRVYIIRLTFLLTTFFNHRHRKLVNYHLDNKIFCFKTNSLYFKLTFLYDCFTFALCFQRSNINFSRGKHFFLSVFRAKQNNKRWIVVKTVENIFSKWVLQHERLERAVKERTKQKYQSNKSIHYYFNL